MKIGHCTIENRPLGFKTGQYRARFPRLDKGWGQCLRAALCRWAGRDEGTSALIELRDCGKFRRPPSCRSRDGPGVDLRKMRLDQRPLCIVQPEIVRHEFEPSWAARRAMSRWLWPPSCRTFRLGRHRNVPQNGLKPLFIDGSCSNFETTRKIFATASGW
jgi:hypothetical protein